MKSARWLLLLAVVVMLSLGIYVFVQSRNRITITSSIPGVSVSLQNRQFLEKKLDEVEFWKENNVSYYSGSQIVPVTVKKLEIVLVGMPQLYGRLVDDANSMSPHVFLSFGTEYDPVQKRMQLLLHADKQEESVEQTNERYTYELLTAIYDTTHRIEENSTEDRLAGFDKFIESSQILVDIK